MTTPASTRPELIAPCGIDCRLCRAFDRQKNACPGCRGDDTRKMKSCAACRIKNCDKLARGKFEYCFECDEFPCGRLAHLDQRYRTRYATSPLENLDAIRQRGLPAFIETENKKWSCPVCGGMLCMHTPECRNCGHAWRN